MSSTSSASLQDYSLQVEIYDPWASNEEVQEEFGLSLISKPVGSYDAIILAVAHQKFESLDISALKKKTVWCTTLKGVLDRTLISGKTMILTVNQFSDGETIKFSRHSECSRSRMKNLVFRDALEFFSVRLQ